MRRMPSNARRKTAAGMAAAVLLTAPALAEDRWHGGSAGPFPEESFAALSVPPEGTGLHAPDTATTLEAERAGPRDASPLPEPATWTLVAAGCALVLYVARRRGG
jgi:hypothetical protein